MFTPEADRLVQAAIADLVHGRVANATDLLDEAHRLDPCHLMALTTQAELALYRKDHARALALTDAALAIETNFAPAWNQRSSACWLAGRRREALQAARQAVDIQPPNPDFRLRLARFAAWSGRGAETRDAIAPLLAAEQYDPVNHAAAVSMLGELAIAEGRFDEARPYLDQALNLQPSLLQTRMMRGMNLLRLGQFAAGWVDYATREALPALYPDGHPPLADQPWQGQALAGKTLVVLDDQGYGDAIQFFRYLPWLRDRGTAHITWRTFSPLVRLLGEAAPYATVLNALSDDARFDFQCYSTNLPRWFGTELNSIPPSVPYQRPSLHLKAAMKRPGGRRPRVGLAWSGDARHTRDHLRSIPADLFLGLADVPGIDFKSLQHEVRTADLRALKARPAIGREVEKAVDFADTAAFIVRLDLVITVDTAIAHLAGALGKPVWVVLHVSPDWRWLAERADSPWYPTARLFRVTPAEWTGAGRPGDGGVPSDDPRSRSVGPRHDLDPVDAGWLPVLTRVATALRAFAAG